MNKKFITQKGLHSKNKTLEKKKIIKESRIKKDFASNKIICKLEKQCVNLEMQLRHKDRLSKLGEMVAGVAHELNEPLTRILGFAQLIVTDNNLSSQIKEDLNTIISSSIHARTIIKRLLLFSKKEVSLKERIDLNQVVKETLELLENRLVKESIDIEYSFFKKLPLIHVVPIQISQVLVNLITNAIDAIQDGGIITIKTKKIKGSVQLIVKDSGIGMDGKILKKIFTPFFTTKKAYKGTGLGLSVVHDIITSHDGVIHAESSPGKGTCFYISFPIES